MTLSSLKLDTKRRQVVVSEASSHMWAELVNLTNLDYIRWLETKYTEALRAQNEKNTLAAENATLRAQNEVLRAQNEVLRAQNEVLKAENEVLRAEISRLKGPIDWNMFIDAPDQWREDGLAFGDRFFKP